MEQEAIRKEEEDANRRANQVPKHSRACYSFDERGNREGRWYEPCSCNSWGCSGLSEEISSGSIPIVELNHEYPIIPRQETVVAYKNVSVINAHGNFKFAGWGNGGAYDVEDTAVCPNKKANGNPIACRGTLHPDCMCGFWAWKSKQYINKYSPFSVEIELFGMVLEAEEGYRATKQRVLSVSTRARCYYCGDEGTHFGQIFLEDKKWLKVGFLACETHMNVEFQTDKCHFWFPKNHLAGLLGTEVKFV